MEISIRQITEALRARMVLLSIKLEAAEAKLDEAQKTLRESIINTDEPLKDARVSALTASYVAADSEYDRLDEQVTALDTILELLGETEWEEGDAVPLTPGTEE